MSSSQNRIPTNSPVQSVDFSKQWALLTEKEKNYAYFMAKASEAGSKIMFHQFVYESPALFLIFQAYFQDKDFYKLEMAATKEGVTQE